MKKTIKMSDLKKLIREMVEQERYHNKEIERIISGLQGNVSELVKLVSNAGSAGEMVEKLNKIIMLSQDAKEILYNDASAWKPGEHPEDDNVDLMNKVFGSPKE